MSRGLRALVRLARTVGHGLRGLATVLWRFPRLEAAARHRHIADWSLGLLGALGIAVRIEGVPAPGAKLIVANHVSWLDIMAIHASCPEARFVSKADVQGWPLISRLVDAAGTLYLQRERKRDSLRVLHVMAGALRGGGTVAVFPEGTTGAGRELLPFHANLLQAPLSAGVPVQPVALRYSEPRHAVSPAAEFIGETTLAESLWRLAAAEGLVVTVRWLPPVDTAGAERRALAAELQARIARALDDR